MPIINGINHDEERLFVAGLGMAVSGGTYVPLARRRSTDANYQANIAAALGVPAARAAAIAAEYPLGAYPSPDVAFSTLVSDANFACPALQVDRWTAGRRSDLRLPVQRRQRAASASHRPGSCPPSRRTGPSSRTSSTSRTRRSPRTLTADQQALAASMRAAWASFAASGNPSSRALPWPSFERTRVLSLVPPQSQVTTDFAAAHHCSFWAAG